MSKASGRRRSNAGDQDARSAFERLMAIPDDERAEVIRALTMPQKREFAERWWQWSLAGQRTPPGPWRVWVIRAGRGFGKTRAGAEWVSEVARKSPSARIALVGATIDEARRVMIEGTSGLIAVAREDEKPVWQRHLGELRFASGARAHVYSAAAPEALRGPEHSAAWCDELAKWPARGAGRAWDNLMMGLRVGDDARVLVTTTPRSGALLRRLLAMPGTVETRGRTRDNPWLAPSFVEAMTEEYGGTRLGRQELDGELIDEADDALWTRDRLEACRIAADAVPELVRVVVGVDPPASAGGDACGIVCAGLGRDGRGYVLEDASVTRPTPERWARAVAACAARRGADRVVAEKNQGGDMVASVLRAADCSLPVMLVHASRGKAARAEPVSLLYEAGKVSHAGAFPALEDELCGIGLGGSYEGPGRSPDRADALVWALWALMGRGRRGVSVRTIAAG